MKYNLKKGLKRQQAGFTLIELLLVVGIMALGAVLAYYTYPKVQSTNNANAEAASINTLAAGIKNVYAGSNSYASLNNSVLIKAKAVPQKMIEASSTTDIRNGFGGAVTVAPTKLGTTGRDNSAYQITYNNVPDAECVKMSTGVGNNFGEVRINGVAAKAYPSTDPVDPSVATTNCTGNANVIIFQAQ